MDLNRVIGYTLRAGVLAAALLSLAGLTLWASYGFSTVDPVSGAGVLGVFKSVVLGNVAGTIYLGVVVLIATPIFRVALSVVHFAMERDHNYVGITLLVLAMLVFALFYQVVS